MSNPSEPKTPELRFPEFEGEWENKKGGVFFGNSRATGHDGLPIYSVTTDRGLVRRDSLDREMGSDADSDKNLSAKPSDLVYNMMRMWQGAVGKAETECMISPAYVVLSPRPGTSSDYFFQWFKSAKGLYKLWSFSHGLTSDRLRLYYRDFAQIPIFAPSGDEQTRIASFLTAVDEKLEALRKKRDLLSDYKRGVMQQIFNREIRFKADDGSDFPDWEEKRLGDIASFLKGRGVSKDDISETGSIPCIRYGELYTHYGQIIHNPISKTNQEPNELVFSQANDVIIPSSGETAIDIATASCVTRSGIALGGDINIIRSSINGVLLAYLLSGPSRIKLARVAQGISVIHMYSVQLSKLCFSIPVDQEEQHKIANFLSSIDVKINAISERITHMEAFKKGLLQRLFV